MKNSKLKFNENMLNISRSNVFGKLFLIVYTRMTALVESTFQNPAELLIQF